MSICGRLEPGKCILEVDRVMIIDFSYFIFIFYFSFFVICILFACYFSRPLRSDTLDAAVNMAISKQIEINRLFLAKQHVALLAAGTVVIKIRKLGSVPMHAHFLTRCLPVHNH